MRIRLRTLGLLALACAALPSAEASDQVGPIEVIQLSQRISSFRFGYVEHRMQLRNLSSQSAHTVVVQIPAHSYGHGNGAIERITRTVVLHPGDTAEISLPQPARRIQGSHYARIVVRGVDSDDIGVPSLQTQPAWRHSAGHDLPVFVARGIASHELEKALSAGLGHAPSTTPPGASPHSAHSALPHSAHSALPTPGLTGAESEIAAWSPNWLAYSCFAAVVLSADDWRGAPAPVRAALLRYVSCGGVVLCLGEIDAPPHWALEQNDLAGGRSWAIGAGHLLALNQPPQDWDTDSRKRVAAHARAAAERWHTDFDVGAAHRLYPVVEDLSMPVAGFFYLLLGFALLAGPGLLIGLARIKKKIWLLWAVPALSTVAGGIILVYALLADGITPSRRADTLVFLDQTRHEGTVLGLTGYYAPLTPSGGLRFSANTALAAFESHRHHYRRHGQNRPNWRIDFTRGQHMMAGLVQARVPQVLQVRKPFTARERLDLQAGPDHALTVLNGLGADIHRLRVHAANGDWFESGPLRAGERTTLTRSAERGAEARPSVATAVANATAAKGWAQALQAMHPDSLELAPGTYAAELSHCPFLERGIEGRLHNKERSLVIGRYTVAAPAAEPSP